MRTINWLLASLALLLASSLAYLADRLEFGAAASGQGQISVKAQQSADRTLALLPDFRLASDAQVYDQIYNRPLFNPTRRPAPAAPPPEKLEPPKPQIRRGLYELLGVSDWGGQSLAQLREVGTGRIMSVKQGSQLQELRVADIKPDQVILTFQGESDVLRLAKFTPSARVASSNPAPRVAQSTPQPEAQRPVTDSGQALAATAAPSPAVANPAALAQAPAATNQPANTVENSNPQEAARQEMLRKLWK